MRGTGVPMSIHFHKHDLCPPASAAPRVQTVKISQDFCCAARGLEDLGYFLVLLMRTMKFQVAWLAVQKACCTDRFGPFFLRAQRHRLSSSGGVVSRACELHAFARAKGFSFFRCRKARVWGNSLNISETLRPSKPKILKLSKTHKTCSVATINKNN